jgi:Domain of unknown function (DUF5658)
MDRIVCVVFVCAVFAAPAAAFAQEDQSASPAVQQSVNQRSAAVAPAAKRPSFLVPMYVSFGVLQGLDYVTTTRALAAGTGREANPVMASIAGNRPALLAVKAGTTATTVWIAERMWKKHPVRAIALIAAANGAIGLVVAHNASIR